MLAGFFYFGCWLLALFRYNCQNQNARKRLCNLVRSISSKSYRLVQFRKLKNYRLVQFKIVIL